MFHVPIKGIRQNVKDSLLVIASDLAKAEQLKDALDALHKLLGETAEYLLIPEMRDAKHRGSSEQISARSGIYNAALGEKTTFISSIMGLLGPAPDPEKFKDNRLALRLNDDQWAPEKLSRYLVSLNYDNEAQVYLPGEYSWRGGIFDLYSPAHNRPVRVEYFGNVIESLRLFDPQSQRSEEEIEQCQILPIDRVFIEEKTEENVCIFDYFDEASLTIILCEIELIKQHLSQFGHHSHGGWFDKIINSRCKKLFLIDDTVESNAINKNIFRCGVDSLSHLSIANQSEDCVNLNHLHHR